MELKNFHTHTTYCDGKNTAEEMILAAINQGFTALGFSGHSHTSIDPSYCMTTDETRRYIDELKALREKYRKKVKTAFIRQLILAKSFCVLYTI